MSHKAGIYTLRCVSEMERQLCGNACQFTFGHPPHERGHVAQCRNILLCDMQTNFKVYDIELKLRSLTWRKSRKSASWSLIVPPSSVAHAMRWHAAL